MKSRSEALRSRSEAKAKPSAEERTLPLTVPPGAKVRCEACAAISEAEKCATRADGTAECPECGGPVLLVDPASAPPPASAERKAVAEKPARKEPKDPHRKYCGECGSEWTFTDAGLPFINCGHTNAERIEDPRKAKKYGPPAGIGYRVDVEVERRNKADADAAASSAPKAEGPKVMGVPIPTIGVKVATDPLDASAPAPKSGTRMTILWGEARMPYDQFNGIKVGGHMVTFDVPEGEAEAERAIAQAVGKLEEIADVLFERQKAWYDRKLRLLADNEK